MKKQTRISPTVVGGSTLMAIFAVVTLCVFALLSLSTVLSQQRLSQAAAQSVQRYYEADLQAEEAFAKLKTGEIPCENGAYHAIYPISETQWLITEFENQDGQWHISRWQTVAQNPREADDSLPVWTGNTP